VFRDVVVAEIGVQAWGIVDAGGGVEGGGDSGVVAVVGCPGVVLQIRSGGGVAVVSFSSRRASISPGGEAEWRAVVDACSLLLAMTAAL